MGHGKIKGRVTGRPCGRKRSAFRTWDAAMRAIRKQKDPEGHPYRGDCCGWYHITRYSTTEYDQRQAASLCTLEESGDTVFSLVNEEVWSEETWDDEQGTAGGWPEGAEPGASSEGSRDAAFLRGESSRSTPSPATLARFLKGRRSA